MNRMSTQEFLLAELEEDLRLARLPRPLDLPELARVAAMIATIAEAETPATVLASGRQRLRAEFARPTRPAPVRSWHRAAIGTAAAALAAGLLALGGSAGGYALPGMPLFPWSSASAPAPEPGSAAPAPAETNAALAELALTGRDAGADDGPAAVNVVQGYSMLSVNLADVAQTGGEIATLLQQNGVVVEPGGLPDIDGIDFGDGNEVHFDLPAGSVDVVGGEQPSVHVETESATVEVDSADGGSVQVDANGFNATVAGGSEPSVTFATDDTSMEVRGGTSPSVDIQAGDVGLHVEPGQMPVFEGIDLPETPAVPTVPLPSVTPAPVITPVEVTPLAPPVTPAPATTPQPPQSAGPSPAASPTVTEGG